MDENSKEVVIENIDKEEKSEAILELNRANELLVDFYNQWLKALNTAKVINKEYFEHRAKSFANEVCIDMHNIQGKIAIVKDHLEGEKE